MPTSYESLSPNGHQTMLERVFTKLKALFDTKQNVLTAGKFIDITNDVITSDQADEMTYAEYQQLSQSEIMDGTIRFLDECPDDSYCWYDAETETLWFEEGFAQYDSETETLWV